MSSNSFFISFLKSSDSSLSHFLDTKLQACFIHYLFSSLRQTPATYFRVRRHLWSFNLPCIGFCIFSWSRNFSSSMVYSICLVAHLSTRVSCLWGCSCCWHLRTNWNYHRNNSLLDILSYFSQNAWGWWLIDIWM